MTTYIEYKYKEDYYGNEKGNTDQEEIRSSLKSVYNTHPDYLRGKNIFYSQYVFITWAEY